MADRIWRPNDQATLSELLQSRLGMDPSSDYLDVRGTTLSAADVVESAVRLASGLRELGVHPGDRVATLLENSPEMVLAWWAIIWCGAVAVPINTAYKGEYLRHQLHDSGCTVLIVEAGLSQRAREVAPQVEQLGHAVVVGAGGSAIGGVATHRWDELLSVGCIDAAPVRPQDLATFVYTGGTTGLSKGCMLTHGYHVALADQIGYCWERTHEDVVWTPLPLFHYNALVTVVVGTLLFGGKGAIYRRFSVSNFWPEMNRVGATITSTLGTMAYLLAHDTDRPEMPKSLSPAANSSLRLIAAAPLPPEVDDILHSRFGVNTFSGAYGLTAIPLT